MNLTQRCCGTALIDGMIRKQVNQQPFFLSQNVTKYRARFLPKNKFEAACRHILVLILLG